MTQIYGTFGPACVRQEILESMLKNGMTGIRLNLSHCDLSDVAEQIRAYHAAASSLGLQPQLVVDTQGPELRIGDVAAPIQLSDGEEITFEASGICFPPEVAAALECGQEVLLDDGKISLHVTDAKKGSAVVNRGGMLQGRKSVKLPGKELPLPILTERDRKNIREAKQYGVTGLLQPFVHSGAELQALRKELTELEADHLQIFAKIETLDGADHLEDIIPHADVIVIARGDLGNDMPLWQLPSVQRRISEICRAAGKPFIVVTQMLASMEHAPIPTRAEVNDVFHAVLDGAWGVMLTGETAVGKYPAEAVRYLAKTAESAYNWNV